MARSPGRCLMKERRTLLDLERGKGHGGVQVTAICRFCAMAGHENVAEWM